MEAVPAKIIPFPARHEIALTDEDRDLVLLAADEMIAKGGKELLVQVLKGMHSDLVLEHDGEKLRRFGAMAARTLGEIEAIIDRTIEEGLLRVEHYSNRAMLVHTDAGWARVKPLWAASVFHSMERRAEHGETQGLYAEIGRVHREVKQLVLERIAQDGSPRFAPLLEAWSERESKGMKRRIGEVLDRVRCESPSSSPR